MSTDDKTHLSALAAKELGPVNAAVLLSATFVGGFGTAAVDILGPSLPAAAPVGCAVGWLIAVLTSLALLGRNANGSGDARSAKGYVACIIDGCSYARKHRRYALILLLMTLMAAYAVVAKLRAEQGGVLGAMLSVQQQVADEGVKTREAIVRLGQVTERQGDRAVAAAESAASEARATRSAMTPTTPEQKLQAMGLRASDQDAWIALAEGKVPAIKLMRKAGVSPYPVVLQQANAVEELLVSRNSSMHEAMTAAGVDSSHLNTPYRTLATVRKTITVPDLDGLLRAEGLKEVTTVGGTPFVTNFKATLLLLAVWNRDEKAIKALLAHGASSAVPGSFTVTKIEGTDGSNAIKPMEKVEVRFTPASEARRIGFASAETLLAH